MNVLIAGHCLNEGMDRSAEFEIAANADRKVVEPALELADRHHIEQRLRGMLVSAVTGVDDRDIGVLRGDISGAFFVVPDGRDIRKAGDDADRIGNAFPLRGR